MRLLRGLFRVARFAVVDNDLLIRHFAVVLAVVVLEDVSRAASASMLGSGAGSPRDSINAKGLVDR